MEPFWALLAGSWAVPSGLGWLLAGSWDVLSGLGWLLGGPGPAWPGLALTRGRRTIDVDRCMYMCIYVYVYWVET